MRKLRLCQTPNFIMESTFEISTTGNSVQEWTLNGIKLLMCTYVYIAFV